MNTIKYPTGNSFKANYVAEVLKNNNVKKATIGAAGLAGLVLASNIQKAYAIDKDTYSSTPILANTTTGDANIYQAFGKIKTPFSPLKKNIEKTANLPNSKYDNLIKKMTSNLSERIEKLETEFQKKEYSIVCSTRNVDNKNYNYTEKTFNYLDSKTGEIIKQEIYHDDILFSQDYFIYDSEENLVEKVSNHSITKYEYENGRLIQSLRAYDEGYLTMTSYGKDGTAIRLEKVPHERPILKTNILKIQNQKNDDINPLELEIRNILGTPTNKKGLRLSIKTVYSNPALIKEYKALKGLFNTYKDDYSKTKEIFKILEKYSTNEDQDFINNLKFLHLTSSSYVSTKIDNLIESGKREEALAEIERYNKLSVFDRSILNDKKCKYGNHIRRVYSNGTVEVSTGHYEFRIVSWDHDLSDVPDWHEDSYFTYKLDNVAKEGWTRDKILETMQNMNADEKYEFEKELSKISAKYD